jgi:hypothetical protein
MKDCIIYKMIYRELDYKYDFADEWITNHKDNS